MPPENTTSRIMDVGDVEDSFLACLRLNYELLAAKDVSGNKKLLFFGLDRLHKPEVTSSPTFFRDSLLSQLVKRTEVTFRVCDSLRFINSNKIGNSDIIPKYGRLANSSYKMKFKNATETYYYAGPCVGKQKKMAVFRYGRGSLKKYTKHKEVVEDISGYLVLIGGVLPQKEDSSVKFSIPNEDTHPTFSNFNFVRETDDATFGIIKNCEETKIEQILQSFALDTMSQYRQGNNINYNKSKFRKKPKVTTHPLIPGFIQKNSLDIRDCHRVAINDSKKKKRG